MGKAKKFFKDVAFYLGSNFFSNILGFITGVFIRRMLQPALMGLFNEIMLVFDYARYAHLGIVDALDKELPYYYGSKDYQKLERLRDVGFSFCLMITILLSAGLFIASFVVKFSSALLIYGIRIVSLMVIFRMAGSLYITMNRSRNRFSVISKYIILSAICDVIFKVVLTIKFGLPGLLWASVLTLVAGAIFFYKASGEKFRFILDFSFSEITGLFKIGFPIYMAGFVFMNLTNIDRIMIIRFLDREKLGFYTIALMASVYTVQLPNLIYAVFFPRFYQAYGEKKNILDIKELFIKPTLVFAYLFPILIGLVIIGLPLLVQYLLPAYLPGLLPAYILVLGSSFIALVNMPGYLLIALNRQTYMVAAGLISIVLAVSLIYLFVRGMNLGLAGVALGASGGYFLYATILIAVSLRSYTHKFWPHIKFLAELYFPFAWVVMLLLALQVFIFKVSGNILEDLRVVFLKGIIFLFCCLPLILYVNKKTSVVGMLRAAYLEKKGQ